VNGGKEGGETVLNADRKSCAAKAHLPIALSINIDDPAECPLAKEHLAISRKGAGLRHPGAGKKSE